jgi:bifunctional non-homologous end joining protein LigD
VLLDGEVVAFDAKGVSRFQLLQRGDLSLRFAVFDCLYRNGADFRSAPLAQCRQELEAAVGTASEQLLIAHRLAPNGLTAFSIAKRKGLEGIIAKDGDSPYEERRSRKWLKVKVHQEDEFVIGGFTAPARAEASGSASTRRLSWREPHLCWKSWDGIHRADACQVSPVVLAIDS